MKKHCIIFLLFLPMIANAQIVNIPDANFKAKLLSASPQLNIAKNQTGQKIKIDINDDSEIQVSEALQVYSLVCVSANISSMTGIEAFTNLTTFLCHSNNLTTLDVTMLTNLVTFDCYNNDLVSLNMNGLSLLSSVDCRYNQLVSINLSGLPALHNLDCSNNVMTSLPISGHGALTILNCSVNLLTSLDLSGLPSLTKLSVDNNQLAAIDISGLPVLATVDCSSNNLTLINLSAVPLLTNLNCNSNQLTTLDVTALPNLSILTCIENAITSLNVTGLSQLQRLECSHNQLSSLSLTGVTALDFFDCGYNSFTTLNLTGTDNISVLKCAHNQISTLNTASNDFYGGYIDCSYNELTGFDASAYSGLFDIIVSHNQLTSFIMPSGPIQLESLNLSFNQLTSLTISGDIWNFNCVSNPLTSLSIFGNISAAYCGSNPLTDFNAEGNFDELFLDNTSLQSIHLEEAVFGILDCENSPNLQALYIKNGDNSETVLLNECPMFQYICADPAEVAQMSQITNGQLDLTNIEVNSYCSYTPGAFYDITGHQQFDADNNGCSLTDMNYPNLQFDITNGIISGTIISDTTGNYAIPVQAGTHTITPVFELPYFTAIPTSVTVTFPAAASPAVQNFCIIPNGNHPDVEVAVLNTNTAVPGFDASYRIVYKNKGTTTASGAVGFSFDDATLDFVSATPVTDSQSTGFLSWNYTNLLPFETRAIIFTLNLNSPVETPPLNEDDMLQFTANINLTADENLADNVAVLNQTVFNAFDPNDKTCLEGATITPQMVGEYVHYKIRFENTGNYPAAIVTVKDVIDTSKFDISTLTPITASHPFITRITNSNQVEFVFDNIMLPFDDANNDGYVVFKIKTKPTLVLGDQLTNTAGIYFNYNAPVITNTAVTTVAVPLGVDGNPNAFGFALYPNPVKEVLNISSKTNANIDSVVIYNTLGQEVMKVLPALGEHAIDVSKLSVGHYVVSVTSETVHWAAQFIKD